jgi:hypothetical protein
LLGFDRSDEWLRRGYIMDLDLDKYWSEFQFYHVLNMSEKLNFLIHSFQLFTHLILSACVYACIQSTDIY